MYLRAFFAHVGKFTLWLFVFCLLSLAEGSSFAVWAAPMPQDDPLPRADLGVERDLAQPRIVIAGRSLSLPSGSHIGPLRVSPDGERVAVTVVPAGTETDHLAEIYLFDGHSGDLLDRISGHSARWQDSRQLIYEHSAGRLIYDRSTGRAISDPIGQAPIELRRISAAVEAAIDYPQTIRVAHHPENGCRNVPHWQVDVIPFEEYVKRSVPAEVPISWPLEALKAQAVAARTYAWHKIRMGPAYTPAEFGRVPYDVTDWANYQMMCDTFYAPSNRAADETSGQYLSAQSDANHAPIIAMYSAQNSYPTLDNLNVDYLRAVPDRMGLGKERYGHGWGLSQWGARDRAALGHTYRQILGFYYTNVYLQNAFDPAQPLGGLIGLEPNGFLPPGGIRWSALTPYTSLPAQLEISTSGSAIPLDGRSGVWRNPWIAGDGALVNASLWLASNLQETISLRVDRTPPAAPSLTAPATAETPTVGLTVSAAAEDQIGVSNGQHGVGWIWQGEALSSTVGTGTVTVDTGADGGMVRLAQAGIHTAGSWYGPYTNALPHAATYRALFRLRIGGEAARMTNSQLPDQPIARLDVNDQMGELGLGLRDIWASDFPAGEEYIDLGVDFHIFQPTQGLEFRVHWRGNVDLALDRIEVFRLVNGGVRMLSWPLAIHGEMATVKAVAFDAAGNVSAPTTQMIRVIDEHPPTIESIDWPQGWQTQLPITITATLIDPGSGLNFESGQLWVGDQPRPLSFSARSDPQARQQMSAVLTDLADGEYPLHFRIADRLGNLRQSEPQTLQLDRTRPTPFIRALAQEGAPLTLIDNWLPGPLWVEVSAEDGVSGVSALAYVLDGAPFVLYSAPFRVDGEGAHQVRYWAQDGAGNYSFSQYFDFNLDNTPPTVEFFIYAADEEMATLGLRVEDGGSGVASFAVEVESSPGEWSALTLDPVTRQTTLPFADRDQINVRAQATDRVGHTSAWTILTVQPLTEKVYLPLMEK